MNSDIYTIKIKFDEKFELEIRQICKIQAAREEPRKLISALIVDKEIVLIFELV